MRRGVVGIELARLGEQLQRIAGGVAGHPVRAGHAAQEIVVGVEALGGLALGPLDLGLLQLRRDRADHARGHLILQIEDVLELAIEVIGPQMRPARSIDQLRGDADPLRRLAHAAFEHVTHTQLATDLLHIDGPALVGKARIARDHEQPPDVAERGNDVLDDAVGEIVLLRIIAHVLERQNRDRGLVRKGRTRRSIGEADQPVSAAGNGNQIALAALVLAQAPF